MTRFAVSARWNHRQGRGFYLPLAWLSLLPLLLLAAIGPRATAQAVSPVIVNISPTTVTADTPGFTLTVTGSGFQTSSAVQVNGSNRATKYISALQLSATIFASDITAPGKLQITVFNSFGAGGGVTSNAATLTIVSAPSPILSSVSPGSIAQSSDGMRMTLIGANFRPGATVVISPPLSALANSDGHTRASDILVQSVTVVDPGVITALVTVRTTAVIGQRAVDVLNIDGTSTAGGVASGTSKPLVVDSSSSLGAPLSVLNMSLIHPRDGTIVMQGDQLNAEAVLAGAGTGTVTGEWLWDGKVAEQFSTSIVGGRSTAIQTRQSLPTWSLGAHTVQLRMVQPNQVASRPVEVVVNPGTWTLGRLIQPVHGGAFAASDPPNLLWTPIPGSMKYQVGFSTQPYLSTVRTWFDVVDNRWAVPAEVWKSLPEGELYWTVRAVDTSESPRKPFPMRPIAKLPDGALASANAAPATTEAGDTQLEWMPAQRGDFYFVTISSDPEETHILRRYLTSEPRIDLRAIDRQLTRGATYYWRVDAISPAGGVLLTGPLKSFVARAAPQTMLGPGAAPVLLASLGEPVVLPPAEAPAIEVAGQSPAPGSSTSQLKPEISAAFAPPVNPPDVTLSVDGVDITSLAKITGERISYRPPMPMADGYHAVNLSVGSDATDWAFIVIAPPEPDTASVPAAAVVQEGTDAEAPPAEPVTMPTPNSISAAHQRAAKAKAQRVGPSEDGQIGMTTQWNSGSNPPDSNVVTAAEHVTYQQEQWHFEVNGSGLLNSILNPPPLRTSRGKVNDYVLQIGNQDKHWGAALRFGILSSVLFTDAQYVTAAAPHQAVELTLKTPAGTIGGFTNTEDEAAGGGAGINYKQRIVGASWQPPVPQWAQLRFMWLMGQDVGIPSLVSVDSFGNTTLTPDPTAPKASGDAYGALLAVHFGVKWTWTSEYAASHDNPDIGNSASIRKFGRAWRSMVAGQPGKTNLNAGFHDVSENFGNPANPGLTSLSQPNQRGVDSAISQTTKVGTFGITYSLVENNVHPTTADELVLNSFNETWSRPFGPMTNLSVAALQSWTGTGTVPAALLNLPPIVTGAQDIRDLSATVNLSHQVGTTTFSAGGTRDWNHNALFPLSSTITSTINAGANLVTRGFFQLNGQESVNWVAADRFTVGTSRTITSNLQPAFVWKRPSLQVSPLISVTQSQTILGNGTYTSKTLTLQGGGRLAWTLPGFMKFNTLSAQGTYNENRDNIAGIDRGTTQLFVLWTAVWGHQSNF